MMGKTSVVTLVLLVLAASHFRASSGNEEIASKLCVCVFMEACSHDGSVYTETHAVALKMVEMISCCIQEG